MKTFVARYGSAITATLSGFDRLVFRGTLIPLVIPRGMHVFLHHTGLRLLDYKQYVVRTSERIKEASLRAAVVAGRPIRYLQSTIDKEDLARELLAQHPIKQGLICAFRTVEPCMSFEYHRATNPRERGLRLQPRKCLHIYQYFLHPVFGFINARLQTWFPFNIQVCLNGREWLARQFQRAGYTDFTRHDNCFLHLGDPARAQRLLARQLRTRWQHHLDAIARTLNPLHAQIFARYPLTYYWSAYQTEWATDLLFESPQALGAIYPALLRHAMLHFHSPDIMRFLGRKGLRGTFQGELTSHLQQRPEGVRIKHWVHGNSIKMYDKAGRVLRVETTIAKTTHFKVLRPMERSRRRKKLAWQALRKGVADLHRRAQVSQGANERYLEALATIEDTTPLHQLLDQVARPVTYHGRRLRALRIGDPTDLALLQTLTRGEFATAGFRNRDLRALLSPSRTLCASDARRLSARLSRQLRLLRAHGVIKKIPRTHRYQLTHRGQLLTAALFAARNASIQKLVGAAAA